MSQLYTIGHSTYPNSYFLKLLKRHNINCIIDVRSVPFSKYNPQYNMNELKAFLNKSKIYYIFMGEEFGARRTEKALFSPEGYVDFQRVIDSSSFKKGIERVRAGLNRGYNIAFMCTEKDPIDCHRNILVARAFKDLNYKIFNILSNGEIETQEQLEERLLNFYFPDRNQLSLLEMLDSENKEVDLLEKAYQARNKEIGYRDEIEMGVR